MVVLDSPTPVVIGGARTASRNVIVEVSISSLSVDPIKRWKWEFFKIEGGCSKYDYFGIK